MPTSAKHDLQKKRGDEHPGCIDFSSTSQKHVLGYTPERLREYGGNHTIVATKRFRRTIVVGVAAVVLRDLGVRRLLPRSGLQHRPL